MKDGDYVGWVFPAPVKIGTATWTSYATGVLGSCGIRSDGA